MAYIVASEVSTLKHELWNDSMEPGTLITKAFLTSAQGTEVLGSLWYHIIVEEEVDTTGLLYKRKTR